MSGRRIPKCPWNGTPSGKRHSWGRIRVTEAGRGLKTCLRCGLVIAVSPRDVRDWLRWRR